jgi:alkyl sulfatase BDS1-like metallo-beta-lactamase superfamily hydrolase
VASFEDRQDFEDAERGRIDALDPCVVRAADGRVVWDLDAYSYLDGECPDTVNPSRRMLNNGATGLEIAEDLQLPPGQAR